MTALERFLNYVKYYTTSDPASETNPSTEIQKVLGNALMEEMSGLGLCNVHMDDHGNVYGTLKANKSDCKHTLALIAHMDTSCDAPGENVKASIVTYTGGELKLSDEVSLTEALCPGLSEHIGEEIIVTDGTTLLGADDKSGIAEILTAVESIIATGEPHGEVHVIFTTDEEIGRGADGIDVETLGCDVGYTVDGGPIGEVEYENFNAASAVINVHGVGVHPGSAKDVMVNAITVAMELQGMLPKNEVPERTEGYQGFFHLSSIEGSVTGTTLRYIIRDHDRDSFERRKKLLTSIVEEMNRRYGEGTVELELKDSYYNMKEKILPHMELIEKAKQAFVANGVEPKTVPIRGGTDGAVLSWRGLPCPNLSTGGYNYHGVREWIPAKSLDTMALVVKEIIKEFAE